MRLILFIIAMFVSLSLAVDGYQDLKFGMTREEANATKVMTEGVVMFGAKRKVEYRVDDEQKVCKIYVDLGEFDTDIQKSLFDALSKKYTAFSSPTENELNLYNKEVETDYDFDTIVWLQLKGSFEDRVIRAAFWDFDNAQASLAVIKLIYVRGAHDWGIKDNMYLVYRTKDLAESYYNQILKTRKIQNKKITLDDL